MTMKPKAKKFRTRGQQPAAEEQETASSGMGAIPVQSEGMEGPDMGAKAANAGKTGNTIENIRQEGLTGRQLRMARRVAQKHGLAVTSDFDAVRQLRDQGIDPFQRSNSLELVDSGSKALGKVNPQQLPQTVAEGEGLPAEMSPAEEREFELNRMQVEIVKRRQRRMAMLGLRLMFFVGLPTLFAAIYFYIIATPLYSTKSAFLIQQNEAQSAAAAGAGGLGGLLGGGSPLATVLDSIAVQGYLTSLEAMIRLDNDHGFREHFSDPNLDFLTRVPPDASNSRLFSQYKSSVKIGYDPTEGIIQMEVTSVDPDVGVEFSRALIGYAEEQISNLSLRLREDQMKSALEGLADAEKERAAAVTRLVQLQTETATIDPMAGIQAILGQISTLETEIVALNIQLQEQLANRRPNEARVEQIRRSIEGREDAIVKLNSDLLDKQESGSSRAEISAQLQIAQTSLETRTMMVESAVQAVENARAAAVQQARYLAESISPVAADAPSYPRAFENTLLALLIFSGIYLLMSLTASILREQV